MHSDINSQKTQKDSTMFGRWLKGMLIGVAAIAIFLSGLGLGNGTISFGTPSPNSSNADLPEDLNYASVERLYDLLKADYDGKLDADALIDGLKSGLISSVGDPYTQYFDAEAAKAFNAELSGSFSGIGAELGEDEDGNLIIATPMEGYPASKAGLRSKDIIVSIDGKTTADMTTMDAVSLIRGEKGTDVTLRILRDKKQNLSFTITRQDIQVATVKSEILNGNIGYLQITQFGDDTIELATKAARQFVDRKVKGVIVDVRDDPGGRLDTAIDIAELWLPAGKTILQEKQANVVVRTHVSEVSSPVLEGMPTAVLINAGSASASEIVAGALRDHKVATLIGEKTYGKGSVQQIRSLTGGSEVKITVARWYRPNGKNIDKKGILPDKEIIMSEEDYQQDRDPQKETAIKLLEQR